MAKGNVTSGERIKEEIMALRSCKIRTMILRLFRIEFALPQDSLVFLDSKVSICSTLDKTYVKAYH